MFPSFEHGSCDLTFDIHHHRMVRRRRGLLFCRRRFIPTVNVKEWIGESNRNRPEEGNCERIPFLLTLNVLMDFESGHECQSVTLSIASKYMSNEVGPSRGAGSVVSIGTVTRSQSKKSKKT